MLERNEAASIEIITSVGEIEPAQWDACAGPDNPFVSHAFLHALESSGSASGRRGWLPRHLVVRDSAGSLCAAAPLYLKSHSYGEYVFDWAWADAYERAGGRYYPKLQCASPFTPVTGPRLMVRHDLDSVARYEAEETLAAGLVVAAERHGASSVHVTFPTRAEWQTLGRHGFLQRVGMQYHFMNPGYRDFEDFLEALASRKRKQIRRERREVAESGIRLHRLHGSEMEPRHWEAFYDFYLATADKRWGFPYLKPEFFEDIGRTMGDRILMVLAEAPDGRPVAGALNLLGSDAVYGRNWGCLEDFSFLHFEACYYQAIEYAIENGFARVEAGAQGEHKIQRGYLPVETYSAHWFADSRLEAGVADFLEREQRAVRARIAGLGEHSPFKRT